MIIFSQDRLSVINFDNVATLDANIPECPNQLVATFPTGKGIPIGKFKDDDRLKEVIDEFAEHYRKAKNPENHITYKNIFFVPKE